MKLNGAAIHYLDLAAPVDCRLDVVLLGDGDYLDLDAKLFADHGVAAEMKLHRSATFVDELLTAAHRQGKLIEDVQRHLKGLPDFAVEYAMVKAIAELQARILADQTTEMFKKRGAA